VRNYYAILRYAFRQWPKLLVILALNMVAAGTAALQPWPMKLVIDHALGDVKASDLPPILEGWTSNLSPVGLIGFAATAMMVLFVVNSAVNAVLTWAWMVAGRRMVYDVAADLFRRLQRMSLLFHTRRRVGDSLALVTDDAWSVYTATNALMIGPLRNLFTLFAMGPSGEIKIVVDHEG